MTPLECWNFTYFAQIESKIWKLKIFIEMTFWREWENFRTIFLKKQTSFTYFRRLSILYRNEYVFHSWKSNICLENQQKKNLNILIYSFQNKIL